MTTQLPSRRSFCHSLTAGTLGLTLAESAWPANAAAIAAANDWLLYIGTYTNTKSKSEGIYIYRFNAGTGELKPSGVAKLDASPSFLAIDAKRKFLYAVNEVGEFNGQKNGGVTAYAIDQKNGDLKMLNQQHAPGVPCHVSVHPSGKFVLIADYGGGNAAIYPVKVDGSLGPATDVAQHAGKGGDPKRQTEPHAHSIMVGSTGEYAFVPDLGLDRIMIYRIDTNLGKLLKHSETVMKPASGPRHFAFHPNEKFAYVINELNSTVTAFAYGKLGGTLREMQSISTLPADFSGTSYCADIHIHPTGKYLYGSNRGHDSIVAYAIDGKTGQLTLIGHESVGGKWPRNFALDPTGRYLLVANQNTDNIVVLGIDVATGKLKPTGQQITLGAPVCLQFIPSFS